MGLTIGSPFGTALDGILGFQVRTTEGLQDGIIVGTLEGTIEGL